MDEDVIEATAAQVGRYRKLPVEVEALRLGWDTWNAMCDFAQVGDSGSGQPFGVWVHPTDNGQWAHDLRWANARMGLVIPTSEGRMLAVEGDMVVRGTRGELYPCKPGPWADSFVEVPSEAFDSPEAAAIRAARELVTEWPHVPSLSPYSLIGMVRALLARLDSIEDQARILARTFDPEEPRTVRCDLVPLGFDDWEWRVAVRDDHDVWRVPGPGGADLATVLAATIRVITGQ